MANKVKYENQVWGEDTPIAGERLSTNGHYTGEHLGKPTQDAKAKTALANSNPHFTEDTIIRYGTITQDAIPGSTPTVKAQTTSE